MGRKLTPYFSVNAQNPIEAESVINKAMAVQQRIYGEDSYLCAQGWLIAESSSVSYGKATSYLPIIDLLRVYFQIEPRDDARKIRENTLEELITRELLVQEGQKLKLKVNRQKSKVDRAQRVKFLGFSFYKRKGELLIRVATRALDYAGSRDGGQRRGVRPRVSRPDARTRRSRLRPRPPGP